jgi:hypothetical protein
MMQMKKLITIDARIILETEVPTTWFRKGLNWWMRRKNSWEMGRHGMLLKFTGRIFLSLNGQITVIGVFAQKIIQSYGIACNVVDWIRVPVLVTMAASPLFWRDTLFITIFSTLPLLAYKYIRARKRPNLQLGLWASLTYPIYKQLYAFASIAGAIRCVLFFIGEYLHAKSVCNMIKDNDERMF